MLERDREVDLLLVRLLVRLVFWASIAAVTVDAVVDLWQGGRYMVALAAGILFPVTFVVWPWTHKLFGVPLWFAVIAAVVAQSLSSVLAGRGPVRGVSR